MPNPLRLVFLGSDPIALPLLDWLAGPGRAIAEVVVAFTQPDRAVGRGQQVRANAIKEWAQRNSLPVLQPEKLTEAVRTELSAFNPDLGLVMAYGHILRDEFIAAPRLGMLNLHTSILPRYRGASPIQTAVANGDCETGVTLMRIVRKLDAGPVADVERVSIDPLDTAAEVELKLSRACVPLVVRGLSALASGNLAFTPQDDTAATYCRKLQKEDGAVDFSVSAETLAARINGLFPWPSCSVEMAGQTVKLGLADVVDAAHSASESCPPPVPGLAAPGTVLGADGTGLLVACGRGVLRLRRLQRPGGRMLAAVEFLRGFAIATGTMIPSHPMPALTTLTSRP